MAVWHVVDPEDGYVFDIFDRKRDAQAWIDAGIAACLAANPQIGVLMRNGKHVYYVNSPEYREAQYPQGLLEA
jgi:hypothetical protein